MSETLSELIVYKRTPCKADCDAGKIHLFNRDDSTEIDIDCGHCRNGFTLEPVPLDIAVIEVLKRVRFNVVPYVEGGEPINQFCNVRLEDE